MFSSLTTTKLPIVERQAFIFPAAIESMRETITEKGITSKHIIGTYMNCKMSKKRHNYSFYININFYLQKINKTSVFMNRKT